MISIAQCLTWAQSELLERESPKLDAEVLLCTVLECERVYLLTWPERLLEKSQWQQYQLLVSQRKQGEPVAYLTGEREFWSLPLKVSRASLIPRPDTELLVEQALQLLPKGSASLLDLGTGSGAIALAVRAERPDIEVIGVELQPKALHVAQENATRLQLDVQFLAGSWYQPIKDRRFNLIVSNPPYIDAEDPHLSRGDVRFEPRSALVADQQGLADLKLIIEQAPSHLLPEGYLLTEHGWQQGQDVRALFHGAGFIAVRTLEDYAGNERLTIGRHLGERDGPVD